MEDGTIRYFNAKGNDVLRHRSKLVYTEECLAKLKVTLNKTDVIESCFRKTVDTKWKFYKLTTLNVFSALLKDAPKGCRDAVVPEFLLRNCTITCLTYEQNSRQPDNDNLCPFRDMTPIGMGVHDWKKELWTFLFFSKSEWMDSDLISNREST